MKKRKGRTLYKSFWMAIVFIDLMYMFIMYCGWSTASRVIASSTPEHYLKIYNIFCIATIIFLIISLTVIFMNLLGRIRKGFANMNDITRRLADGDAEIEIGETRNDEFGDLLESYKILIEATKKQAELATAVSNGDLTVKIVERSDADTLGIALKNMVNSNAHSLGNINDAAFQVMTSSSQVASASEALAQGSTEQASAIEQITASISEIAEKTRQNASEANEAAELVNRAIADVKQGNEQMKEMMSAMDDINESSESISKIMKVIDDIAFQTNILALNAAVEAARAGEAGKGFAVVAEEVRNLAAKSASAAAETAELIEDSKHKVSAGLHIADDTASALVTITERVTQSEKLIDNIAESSNYQATAVAQINQAIGQVSQVVQTNSATSEECAAASEELSNQAIRMRELLAVYRLEDVATEQKIEKTFAHKFEVKSTVDFKDDCSNDSTNEFERMSETKFEEPVAKERSVESFNIDNNPNEQIISLGDDFGKY